METVFLVTAACQGTACSARRERDQAGNPKPFAVATTSPKSNAFVVFSDRTEDAIRRDMASIEGVTDVNVQRNGNTFTVTVGLDRFERDLRGRVFAKELQLFDAFPDFFFDVKVVPAS